MAVKGDTALCIGWRKMLADSLVLVSYFSKSNYLAVAD